MFKKLIKANLTKKDVIKKCLILFFLFVLIVLPTVILYIKLGDKPAGWCPKEPRHEFDIYVAYHHPLGTGEENIFAGMFYKVFGDGGKIAFGVFNLLLVMFMFSFAFIGVKMGVSFASITAFAFIMCCQFVPMIFDDRGVLDYFNNEKVPFLFPFIVCDASYFNGPDLMISFWVILASVNVGGYFIHKAFVQQGYIYGSYYFDDNAPVLKYECIGSYLRFSDLVDAYGIEKLLNYYGKSEKNVKSVKFLENFSVKFL